jgi:hypothetical protein
MTQRQLNRAVARATGESMPTIGRMGFSAPADEPLDADLDPLVADWDALEARRRPGIPPSFSPPAAT